MSYFRVHPSINFGRVGNSEEYYIAPETAAGEIVDKRIGVFGGLPIQPRTEDTPITEDDFRDDKEAVKRQAARFRLFSYSDGQDEYPSNDPGQEVNIGDTIDGKVIKDIIWQVHLANKKNNNYTITSVVGDKKIEEGIIAYENGSTPPVRNPQFGNNLQTESRLKTLIIDAGPRALSALAGQKAFFNNKSTASYTNSSGEIIQQTDYPISFPNDHFDMFDPLGKIDTLGEMFIEENTNRLIVAGGYGKASGIKTDNYPPNLCDAIDNDDWFDDTSDGPVCATVVFDDGSVARAVHGWFVCTDPGYAPQTRNVVSTWDDVYDTWIQHLNLQPQIFNQGFEPNYQASFDSDVQPIFHAAFLQRWNTSLPSKGINGHDFMATITPSHHPSHKLPSFDELIRKPSPPGTVSNPKNEDSKGSKMPLALGDAMKSFLALTETQYFLLKQWYNNQFEAEAVPLGQGEKLDKVVLENCLGGRYSPGIDLTFIVRDVNLYIQNWKGEVGPFRINLQALDYANAEKGTSFLQQGYIPLRETPVEPGDLCKFMSQPWHTDYNSCATHKPAPNPLHNNTLYWSWPAQRPVTVYPKDQCTYNHSTKTWNVGGMLFSVRGKGTETLYPQQQGRYQCYFDFIKNWHKVGFIIQGTQINDDKGGNYGNDKFLEVASLFENQGDTVQVWPTASEPGYQKPEDCGPEGSPPCTQDSE